MYLAFMLTVYFVLMTLHIQRTAGKTLQPKWQMTLQTSTCKMPTSTLLYLGELDQ